MPRKHTTPSVCPICGTDFMGAFNTHNGRPQLCCSRGCDAKYRQSLRGDPAVRFWARVDRSDPDGCWLWLGAKRSDKGYGGVWDGERWTHSHRFAYTLTYGPITDGLWVLHKCDNPPCCRPDHLFLGTQLDNIHDMLDKGRYRSGPALHPERMPKGEAHGQAKATADTVRAIRERYAAGGITHKELGREYGLSRLTVGDIIRRRIWRHLP